MLVLTRKEKESILIGDDIEITVVEAGNGRALIAIDAPRNIEIVRKELIDRVEEANKMASHLNKTPKELNGFFGSKKD